MRYIILLCGALMGCAAATVPTDGAGLMSKATLLVANETMEPVALYNGYQRLGTIEPNRMRCFEIPAMREARLQARRSFQTIARTDDFDPSQYDGGWVWRISDNGPVTRTSLEPAARCS